MAMSMKPKRVKVSLKAMIGEASKMITNNTDSITVKPSHGLDKEPNLSQYLK